jgi:polyhydroxyalkanoate synthesis regulator phasin
LHCQLKKQQKNLNVMADNKTQENLRRLFYAGIGLATQASEKVQEAVEELVEKGRLSEKDGQKIVTDLLKKTEGRRGAIEGKYNETVKKFVRLGASEVEKLSKRIEKLENQLVIKGAKVASAKPAAKKATAKATVKPAAKKATPAKAAKPAKKAAKATAPAAAVAAN